MPAIRQWQMNPVLIKAFACPLLSFQWRRAVLYCQDFKSSLKYGCTAGRVGGFFFKRIFVLTEKSCIRFQMTTDCSAPANSAQEQNVWCEKKPTRSILDLQVTLTPVSVRVYMSTIRTREHRFEASKEGGTWKLNIRAKWKFAKYV